MNSLVTEICEGVVAGNASTVISKVKEALAAGMNPKTILEEGMIAAMAEVGRRFECAEFYVPEMLIAARAMKEGLALLKPHLVAAEVRALGSVVIGTVSGDMHDIGKNLVSMMLEGGGFHVTDLGVDVPTERFVDVLRQDHPQILALSALLTTTMPSIRTTIEALKAAGLRDTVKIMIGGAPVDEKFAVFVGADGYAPDASRAVTLAKNLLC